MNRLIVPQPVNRPRTFRAQAALASSPAVVPGLELGQAANLLLGLKATWQPLDAATSPFFAPDTQPLPVAAATVPSASAADWQLPRITLHATTEDLLSAVFAYEIEPLTGADGAFSVPSGPLLVDDLDRDGSIAALSEYLGVDLSAGYRYMLVELVRTVGTVSHDYVAGSGGAAENHLVPSALAALSALAGVLPLPKGSGPLTAEQAAAVVKTFQTFGTHYVSQLTAGDRIFQVFAYGAAAYEQLSAAFQRSAAGKSFVDGVNAMAFQYYTTPRSTRTGVELGYVSAFGTPRIVSGDPAFASSLLAGSWLDSQRASANSVFSAVQASPKVDLSTFQAIVPIAVSLTPLGNLIPVDKSAVGRNFWNRLLDGALLQKHGSQIRVAFPPTSAGEWKSFFPNSGAWLSTIATPTVNAYDGYLDLGEIQLTNRDAVQSFSSWSIVLAAGSGETDIPGETVALASYRIDTAGAASPPVLRLRSSQALQKAYLKCGRMDGALVLACTGSSQRKTVVDGIILETTAAVAETGRSTVAVTGDLFGEMDVARLQEQESNLNFSVVSCQTLLYSSGPRATAAQALSRDCLVWLTEIIPNADATPQSLMALRVRAAYLGHVAGRLDEEGVTVPYLTYDNYQAYIEAMYTTAATLNGTIHDYQNQLAFQRQAELAAKTADEINANIKVSGNLLEKYIDAVAENQGDIAANYQNIIAIKQRELNSALASYSSLAQAVSDQKDAVEDAKLAFQRAMADYQMGEIIKAVINISTGFVTVGIGIATPSSTIKALESLGETAQKIQKLITVLNQIMALEKTIEGTVRNMMAVGRTLDALKQTKLDMPSSLEWSEMGINFEASLASVPSEVAGPKAAFVAAFKILVLRAQAMLAAQSKISQINAEIALNQAQKKINDAQESRLNALTAALHYGDTSQAPDLSEIDLLGLTGNVQSQLNQVLAALAQALSIQDSAVQFELLANPTQIQKFDLASLQLVMASQQGNILAAKQAFNPPPFQVNDPIQVTIKGVPISAFTGGNSYEFVIQPSASEFQPYNMVRVQQVVVDIPAIKGSKNGHYRIDLTFQGDPFEDRDPSGQPLTFNTVARHFGPFEYRAKDHSPVFGDQTGSIGADITRITPFSTWRVSMPALSVNDGVDFGSTAMVDIVLSFRIEALAETALRAFCEKQGTPPDAGQHGQLLQAMTLMRSRSANARALAAAPSTDGSTVQNMLDQMYKAQGVLKNWDCVLNMLEGPVNRFLEEQYNQKYSKAAPMVVTVGFCQAFPAGNQTVLAYTRMSVNLGPPLLAFQANNHNFVQVTQAIQSGYIQTGTRFVPGDVPCPSPPDLDNPDIDWAKPTPLDVSKKPTVTGAVALGMVQGLVTPSLPDGGQGNKDDAHTVVLDFSKSSFVADALNINTNNAQLNLQLSNWFQTNPIQYQINTVVFSDATTLSALQPTKFKLNVLTTNSKKNVLQVFITTNGQQQSNLTINVNEPIPDGFHNSLMINTKIMFQEIFVRSFNKGSSNLQVASTDPGNDYTTWSAKVTSGTVTGEAKFNNTSSSETRIQAGSNNLTWPLSGLTFTPTAQNGIALTYNAHQTVNFQHRSYRCYNSEYGRSCSWSSWQDYSVDVDVGLTGNYPLQVSNVGGKQQVQIASSPPSVTLTPPDLKPTGPCECNNNDLKIQVGQILQKQVPAVLQSSMAGITFTPVSVFALYNLLFPAQDFIQLAEAYVPADLVVLGTFSKYVSE